MTRVAIEAIAVSVALGILAGSAHANVSIAQGINQSNTAKAPAPKAAPAKPAKPAKYCPPKKTTPAAPSAPSVNTSSQANAAAQSASVAQSRSQSASRSASSAQGGNAAAQGGAAQADAANDSHNTADGGNASGQQTNISSSDSYREVRQTPPAFSGNVQPTSSCKNAVNGGASAPVAGLSFGFGTKDEECDRRALAASFVELGDRDTARAVLCQSKLARNLPQCKEQPVTRERTYTREEVDVIVRKAVGK
jgi:hypothetical protein